MQRTVEGTHSVVVDAYVLRLLQEFEEATVLNEWERTCLPPQNEKVINSQ